MRIQWKTQIVNNLNHTNPIQTNYRKTNPRQKKTRQNKPKQKPYVVKPQTKKPLANILETVQTLCKLALDCTHLTLTNPRQINPIDKQTKENTKPIK